MVEQREILEFIGKQTLHHRVTSFEDITERFDLHPVAACDHLKRLWRERLIESAIPRPPRFRCRLLPGESIRDLSFRLGSRGNKRLEWYRSQEPRDWLEELLGPG